MVQKRQPFGSGPTSTAVESDATFGQLADQQTVRVLAIDGSTPEGAGFSRLCSLPDRQSRH